jgi:uncharacterized protein YdaU (DUF1376 family)
MSERPWMPLYIADFEMDTADLSMDEYGLYLFLLTLMWRREDAALPNDMDWLKGTLKRRFANFHGLTFNRIAPRLLARYFALGDDGKWRNNRLTKERRKTEELSENARRNINKRWARVRENKGLEIPPYYDSHSHSHKERRDGRSRKEERKEETTSPLGVWIADTTPEYEAWNAYHRATRGRGLNLSYRGEGEHRGTSGRHFPTLRPPPLPDKSTGGQAMLKKWPPAWADDVEINTEKFEEMTQDFREEELGALLTVCHFCLPGDDDDVIAELAKVDPSQWRSMKQKVLARLEQMMRPGPNQALRVSPRAVN